MTAENLAASIHQRLLNRARESNRPFNEMLQYYAMERFLYRLAKSRHEEALILKGALMLTVWKAPVGRPTVDIDLLGQTENSVEWIVSLIREICDQPVESDGIRFDADTTSGEQIREDADYQGVRVRFRGNLGNARITMQVDIGFGDIVVPATERTEYPTILDFPAPRVRCYSRESAIAEKFEAMIKLGQLNSRVRDFYDIWLLSRQFDFEGSILAEAIQTTFATRQTTVFSNPTAFSDAFATDATKLTQWKAFVRKNRIQGAPETFEQVVGAVRKFLTPPAKSIVANQQFQQFWRAPGPWVSS